MRFYLVLAASLLPAFAAVDGTVTNQTTGKPAANVEITLVQPGSQGMQTLGTAKTDAAGHFKVDATAGPGPQLIQASYKGATYNKMLTPGTPTSGVDVSVYEVSQKPAPVSQDMILFQPSDTNITVNESIIYENKDSVTYNSGVRFYLPPGAGNKVSVSITPPGGMPLTRPAGKAAQPNVMSVDYPVRPGETRFDLAYTLPASKPMIVSGKIVHAEGPTRLVVPNGVTLTGDNLSPLGQEPQTKASIYDVKGKEYKAELQGTGALNTPDANADNAEDSGMPQIHEIPPRVYDKMPFILGIALGILALGFLLLYRSDKSAAAAAKNVSQTSTSSADLRTRGTGTRSTPS